MERGQPGVERVGLGPLIGDLVTASDRPEIAGRRTEGEVRLGERGVEVGGVEGGATRGDGCCDIDADRGRQRADRGCRRR